MFVSSFNLSQSFNYTPYLFYKKWFKSQISSFCIWTLDVEHGESASCSGQAYVLFLQIPRSIVCQLLLTYKDYRKRIIKKPRLFSCLLKLASPINHPSPHTLAHIDEVAICRHAH